MFSTVNSTSDLRVYMFRLLSKFSHPDLYLTFFLLVSQSRFQKSSHRNLTSSSAWIRWTREFTSERKLILQGWKGVANNGRLIPEKANVPWSWSERDWRFVSGGRRYNAEKGWTTMCCFRGSELLNKRHSVLYWTKYELQQHWRATKKAFAKLVESKVQLNQKNCRIQNHLLHFSHFQFTSNSDKPRFRSSTSHLSTGYKRETTPHTTHIH